MESAERNDDVTSGKFVGNKHKQRAFSLLFLRIYDDFFR